MKCKLIWVAWVCAQLCAGHAKWYARLCIFALPRHWSYWGSWCPFVARRAVTTTRRRPVSYFHAIDFSIHVNWFTQQLVCYIYTARHLCIRLRRWRRTRMRTTAERPTACSTMCIYVPDRCCSYLHPWLINMFLFFEPAQEKCYSKKVALVDPSDRRRRVDAVTGTLHDACIQSTRRVTALGCEWTS